ncbi:MAG: hypothetical protein VCA36_03295 [Opitutales bacterium]
MKNPISVGILVAVLAFQSCSKEYSSIVEDWKDEGWREVDKFGEAGPFSYHKVIKSENAKAVQADWIVRGKRHLSKEYTQGAKLYLVLRFEKVDGDVFIVVMSKRR